MMDDDAPVMRSPPPPSSSIATTQMDHTDPMADSAASADPPHSEAQ